MKTKELYVGVSAKVNIGNYESFGLDIGETVVLEEGDNRDDVLMNLKEDLKTILHNEVYRIKQNIKERQK